MKKKKRKKEEEEVTDLQMEGGRFGGVHGEVVSAESFVEGLVAENRGHNMASTIFQVPSSLGNGPLDGGWKIRGHPWQDGVGGGLH